MIQAALVSYLNTKPFSQGLEAFFTKEQLSMQLLAPSQCSVSLREGRSSVALIPVGSLADFEGLRLLKDFGIAANGEVESVFLFSQRPVSEIDTVRLDPHSRTSNGLTRILLRRYWKREVGFLQPGQRDFSKIEGRTAEVVIGDQAWRLRGEFPYVYDLSGEWKNYCGLPFVFAVWAYRPDQLGGVELDRFKEALQWGTGKVKKAALRFAAEFGYSDEEAIHYLEDCIDFRLDRLKHEALNKYFKEVQMLPALKTTAPL